MQLIQPDAPMRQDKDLRLAEIMGELYADPLGHVLFNYPWGTGQLAGFEGPDVWQRGFLVELGEEIKARGFDGVHAVAPIMFSTASGHGIGKSTMTAWLMRFILDTRPHCGGVVTANTSHQLRTKTWSELAKWHNMSTTRHWYQLNAGSAGSLNIYHRSHPETWRIDGQTCEERNSEAFAGLHRANSTPFYIFDEASAIPDKIFEVREGGLTDGEPMVFDWGNPTRNSGRFYQNMKGRFRSQYIRRSIDSRTVQRTNKKLFDKWAKLYGEDSDFFKVRVKGQFPEAGDMQFINSGAVNECVLQDVWVTPTDPLIMGVDVARFGDDRSVIAIRHGRDWEVHGLLEFRGVDTMTLAGKVSEMANTLRPDAIFIDGGGVGGGVVDRCRQLNLDVFEVNFGNKATQKGVKDMRAQCWYNMREAINAGVRMPDHYDLTQDLIGLEYGFDAHNNIVLERKEDAKKRGIASPDLADAYALTYAWPVYPNRPGYEGADYQGAQTDYDPYE